MVRTWACAVRASASSSRSASWSHISGTTRSVARPPISCTRSRTSSRARRDFSRSTAGTSTSQVATIALITTASRSPPYISFRSGTEACASSPARRCRSTLIVLSSGSRARACLRQCASIVVRSRSTSPRSPARCRMSSSPRATRRSPVEDESISENDRTEWSSLGAVSQSGYQTCSATDPGETASSCTRTTSQSEKGASSPRPYPPTATRATPTSGPPAAAYALAHCSSASAVRSARPSAVTPPPR